MKFKHLHQALINEGIPCGAQVTVCALYNKIFVCDICKVQESIVLNSIWNAIVHTEEANRKVTRYFIVCL